MTAKQITFSRDKDGDYIALVTLNDASAFHIEREAPGSFTAKVASLPASYNPQYANIDTMSGCCYMNGCLEFEMAYAVYPKYIQLRSASRVKKAYVITE